MASSESDAKEAARRDSPLDALIASKLGALSDSEVARRVGISRHWLRDVRNGARVPRLHVIERLADALGLDSGELLDVVAESIRRGRERRAP